MVFCCRSRRPSYQARETVIKGGGGDTLSPSEDVHRPDFQAPYAPPPTSQNQSQNSIQQHRERPASQRSEQPPVSSVTSVAGDHCFPSLVSYRLDEQEVLLTRKLATSAFSIVWLAHYHGMDVAIKKLVNGTDDTESFAREVEIMSKLMHPKIVRFIGCTWTNSFDLNVVTEFMAGGDLRTLLDNRKVALSWYKEKLSIAIDIAEALAFLHNQSPKIIHRDLKARNVLLTKKYVAKLNDFSRSRDRSYTQTMTAGVGSVSWSAPEVTLGQYYGEQADIYSFGVVLSELDTRDSPFEETSGKRSGDRRDIKLVIQVAKGEFRPKFSEECPDAIQRIAHACLQYEPTVRPSAARLVRLLKSFRQEQEKARTI
ncbi:hypothetical protein Poli38472_013443 [Pythium oligandrum]|uniref:Protein kinase domain-containing protein n=1 Tax=Pythium oligandrum TaxID=41045 RepID=A0A8K1C7C7_PYTOL|nr:hypothetical protein Poli38472_013443 [Pythium oligandrum]|eukprot:TMW57969.1 hypothetical protein Poli38472_013443 [Pythium oligandrum]